MNEEDDGSGAMHPFALPLVPDGRTLIVFLLPDATPVSDAELAELRVARAALAADGIPERGASDLVSAASDASVSALTTFLLTAGGSALRARWSRYRGRAAEDDWDFDKAWTKVQKSVTAVPPADERPRLISANQDPLSQEWRIECAVGAERFLARVDQASPVVLWQCLPDSGPDAP